MTYQNDTQVVQYYVYVLVLTDIPLADQIVQVGHACLEASNHFDLPLIPCNLILLAVHSEYDLLNTVERADMDGVRFYVFHEPDNGLGFTAACSEPISNPGRRLFRRLPLLQSVLTLKPGSTSTEPTVASNTKCGD